MTEPLTSYTCAECGKQEKAVALSGRMAGHLTSPKGWEPEEYQDIQGWRKGGRKAGTLCFTAWFCSRSCRGRWLIRTEPMGYLRP